MLSDSQVRGKTPTSFSITNDYGNALMHSVVTQDSIKAFLK